MRKLLFLLIKFLIILSLVFFFGCEENSNKYKNLNGQDTSFDAEERLKELSIQLRIPAPPVANFVHSVRSGNLVFLAGHGPPG